MRGDIVGYPEMLPGEAPTEDLVSTTFRYFATGSIANFPFTRGAALNILSMGVNSTTSYRLLQAVRLRAVRIFSAAQLTAGTFGATSASSLQWNCGGSRPRVLTAATMGAGSIGCLHSKPPKDSFASFWTLAGTNEADVLFSVDLGTGDVIELDVVYQLQNGITASFAASALTTTTTLATGKVYAQSFDHSGSQLVFAQGRGACL